MNLLVLRKGFLWFTRSLSQSAPTTAVQWGLDGDIPLMPHDITGDGKADYIIARKTGFLQQAYVRYGDGPNDWTTYSLGLDSSIPQVGNFLGPQFFAWHQRDTGWVALGDRTKPNNIGELLQFGIEENHIIRADGTVVPAGSDPSFPPRDGGVFKRL